MAAKVKSRALIIEDDKDTASLFSHILEFIGFTTDIVQSGEKALAKLRHHTPDIVLLDIHLSSNVSGLNILDYIRRSKRLQNSRIIVITGHPNLVDTIGNKADLVLLKPVSAKQLSTMVLRLCPDHNCENFLYNASHDPLTGLMNHARFKDRLTHAVSRVKRDSSLYFAVLVMRIDAFRALKKQHGELLVNQMLLNFVERIRERIREVDTFCRLSEDKFAILLENIVDPANASLVVARIQAVLDAPFEIQGLEIPITVSIDIINEDLVEQVDAFFQSS
jgi:diguanylate cyclase (GGDEF)-like protein